MSIVKLEDFFYHYPPVDNPRHNAQYRIFNDLGKDIPEQRGEFFPHQRLVHRYFQKHRRGIIISETGTGKTGSLLGLCETFRTANSFQGNNYYYKHDTNVDHAYVVAPKAVIEDFIWQLACIYTEPGTFDKPGINTRVTLKNQVLNTGFYSFLTYHDFNKYIDKLKQDDYDLGDYFASSIIVIDEAHYYISRSGKSAETDRSKVTHYNNLREVLDSNFDIRCVLSTATPMVKDIKEIISLGNLILEDKFDGNLNSNQGLNEFAIRLSGRVFFKGLDIDRVDIQYQGESAEEDPYPLVRLAMTDFQQSIYQQIDSVRINDKVSKSDFYIRAIQTSLAIFPEGELLSDEFKKYFTMRNGRQQATTELKQFIKDYSDQISNKFNYISTVIQDSIESENGVVFVYIEKLYGGAYYLAEFLKEILDMEEFRPTESIFRTTKSNNICDTGDQQLKDTSLKEGKYRFALITSGTSSNIESYILDTLRSPENVDGKLVKVIITTRAGREGISIHHATDIIIAQPLWTFSELYQAQSRAIRSTGFRELLKRVDNSEHIQVNIHYLTSAYTGDDEQVVIDNIDEIMYSQAWDGNSEIYRIMSALREVSVNQYIDNDWQYDNAYRLLYTDQLITKHGDEVIDLLVQYKHLRFDELASMMNKELTIHTSNENQISYFELISIIKGVNDQVIDTFGSNISIIIRGYEVFLTHVASNNALQTINKSLNKQFRYKVVNTLKSVDDMEPELPNLNNFEEFTKLTTAQKVVYLNNLISTYRQLLPHRISELPTIDQEVIRSVDPFIVYLKQVPEEVFRNNSKSISKMEQKYNNYIESNPDDEMELNTGDEPAAVIIHGLETDFKVNKSKIPNLVMHGGGMPVKGKKANEPYRRPMVSYLEPNTINNDAITKVKHATDRESIAYYGFRRAKVRSYIPPDEFMVYTVTGYRKKGLVTNIYYKKPVTDQRKAKQVVGQLCDSRHESLLNQYTGINGDPCSTETLQELDNIGKLVRLYM